MGKVLSDPYPTYDQSTIPSGKLLELHNISHNMYLSEKVVIIHNEIHILDI